MPGNQADIHYVKKSRKQESKDTILEDPYKIDPEKVYYSMLFNSMTTVLITKLLTKAPKKRTRDIKSLELRINSLIAEFKASDKESSMLHIAKAENKKIRMIQSNNRKYHSNTSHLLHIKAFKYTLIF